MNNTLINSGNLGEVEDKINKCKSRKELRLALHHERENKNRKGAIELLEKALEV